MRLLSHLLILLLLGQSSDCFVGVISRGTAYSEHLITRIDGPVVFSVADLTVHMTANTDLIPTTRGFFNLLAILTSPYVAT